MVNQHDTKRMEDYLAKEKKKSSTKTVLGTRG